MTSSKQAIVDLLSDTTEGVKVYDDSTPPVALTGHILNHWPGKSDFATYAWVITVGPLISASGRPSVLGGYKKRYRELVQVDIWVMEKRGSTYAAEKTRNDLVQDVDRCIHHFITEPGFGFKPPINVSDWLERDETGMKRSRLTVSVEYEKTRT